MKRIRTLAAAAVITVTLAPIGAHAQQQFEGRIAFDMQLNGMAMQMTQTIKGSRIRAEISGVPAMGDMVSLMDTETMEMTMIIPAQQAYMIMSLGDLAQTVQQQTDGEDPEIERTGEMETVAGHRCENVNVTLSSTSMTMCIATDLGFYFLGGNGAGGMGASSALGMNPQLEAKFREMFADGFFPLKVVSTGTGQMISLAATSIEPGPVADDAFAVPEGYTKMPGPGGG
jgi:hypothetical protein